MDSILEEQYGGRHLNDFIVSVDRLGRKQTAYTGEYLFKISAKMTNRSNFVGKTPYHLYFLENSCDEFFQMREYSADDVGGHCCSTFALESLITNPTY